MKMGGGVTGVGGISHYIYFSPGAKHCNLLVLGDLQAFNCQYLILHFF